MIDKMSYDNITKIAQELKDCCVKLKEVIADKELSEIEDFISTVDVYTKYLDNTVELYKDADAEIQIFLQKKD